MNKNIFKIFLFSFGIAFLFIPLFASNAVESTQYVDFTQIIYTKNNNEGKLSSLTGNVNLIFGGKYEVVARFRAEGGSFEEYEEFNVLVDNVNFGKTNDPNQGDDYAAQKLGEFQLTAGNHQVKVEHAYNYSVAVGLQSVYPAEIVFKLLQGDPTPSADLTISKSVDKASAVIGDILTYQISYSNTGTGEATNVVISDDFPENYVDVYSTGGGNVSSGLITWQLGTVGPGSNGTKTFKVQVKSLTSSVIISNKAQISGNGFQTEESNTTQTLVSVCSSSVNNPPTADAGPDREVDENNSTTLLGSGSDPDGGAVNYSWSCTGGSLSNSNDSQPIFNAPSVSSDTNYTCTLTVTEDTSCGLSASDSVNVFVRDTYTPPQQNNPPVVNAGPDRDIYENQSVTLAGSGSDPDNDSLSFYWTCTGGSLSNYSAVQPTFNSPSVSADTNYTCTLTATDEHGLSASDSANVLVRNNYQPPVNNPPVANAGPDRDIYENQSATLAGSGSDSDGDSITYFWTCDNGSLSNRYIAQPTYNAPSVSSNTNYTCTLTVTDEHGLSDSDLMNVLVRNENNYNNLEVETNSATNIQENQATLQGSLQDLSNVNYADIYFQWGRTDSYGYETERYSRSITGNFNQAIYGLSSNTLYHFRAVARDNNSNTDYGVDRTFYTSGYNDYDNPPVANAGPDKEVYENESIILSGSGYDPDGGSVTYLWDCNGGTLSNRYASQPVYNANLVSYNNYYDCTLTVTDNDGLTDSDTMRVLVRNRTDNVLLTVEKTSRNLSVGETSWSNATYASSSDVLEFRIIIRSNTGMENVYVKETLPSRLIYQGNLKINGYSNSGDISTNAVNIGYLTGGETKTITFLAKIAAGDYFTYGTTNLVNSVLAYNNNVSQTASSNIYVRKTEVRGIIDIPTGITNSFFFNSLLFPLLASFLLVFIFSSQLIGLDRIWEKRKAEVGEYRAEKKLEKIIKKMKNRI